MRRIHTDEIRRLHKALRVAKQALEMSKGAYITAQELIARIPAAAPSAISPANVAELARQSGVCPKTINNHIRELVRLGLVRNACLGGGRRRCEYDCQGQMVAVYGIDFSPLLARAEELDSWSLQKKEAATEHRLLRTAISATRHAIRQLLHTAASPGELQAWTSFPRRIAHLCLDDLKSLAAESRGLLAALSRKKTTDQSEIIARPYTTSHRHSDSCKPAVPADEKISDDASAARPTCGLEHITFDMALQILPEDWRFMMELRGNPSWRSFVDVAYQRAGALDIHPGAWSQAQCALGRTGAALLVLLADTQSSDRGGPVRSPGGWVRRMSERAESGTAHLHRTVFGLLHRDAAR